MAPNGPSEPPRADQAGQAALRPVSSQSILVVDDDPDVLELVGRVLRRAGADVTTVATGREGLRAIADGSCRPTLLLTDINMPVMGGIELSARVRALRPTVRVVMMTGDPASAEAARDRPDLVTRVLMKPVTVAELLDAAGLRPAGVDGR